MLWLELPRPCDSRALFAAALAKGICFAPGDVFSASGRYRNCLRISCASPWSARLEGGVATLGALAAAQLARAVGWVERSADPTHWSSRYSRTALGLRFA